MKKVILRLLGASAAMALVGCVGANVAKNATAVDVRDAVELGSTSGTQFNVRLKRVLEVTMPTSVKVDVDPSSTGTGFGTGEVAVKIATNNPTGYNLSMYMVGDTADLKNSVPTYTRGIPTITSDGSSDAFADTLVGWGWKLTQGDDSLKTTYYQTIPAGQANATTIAHTDTPTNDITTTVEFGVQVKDITLPSGVYTGTVNFVAVVNNVEYYIPEYMQDFDSSIADYMEEGQQYTIKDKRDEKIYWISKLRDGHVWMTQNLDLVLNTDTILTREDTDLNGDVYAYTPKHNTTSGSLGTAQTDEYSWEGGEVYWKDSEQWRSDTNTPVANGLIGASSPFKDHFTSEMPTTEGKHYHVGNYYQWATATAGSGNEVTTGGIEASSSICPRGWRLPDSSNNTNDYSFGKMLSQYGLQSSNTSHNINKAPLYVVPGGRVGGGAVYYAAGSGVYWSSRSNSDTDAYYLYFNTSGVNPSNYYNRYLARSVRCVAR